MRVFKFAKQDCCPKAGILVNNANFELPTTTNQKQMLLK